MPDDHELIWGNAVNAPSTVMPMKEGTECNNETEEMDLSSTILVFFDNIDVLKMKVVLQMLNLQFSWTQKEQF